MKVVGVIDLLDSRAVHARGGDRARYAPVVDAGGHGIPPGDAVALARTYLERFMLSELYVADLDAILGRAPQSPILNVIAALGAPVWADTAVRTAADARTAIAAGASRAIVGLETLPSFEALAAICEAVGGERVAFSLDLRNGQPLTSAAGFHAGGAASTIARRAVQCGVHALIVLDLARVGMESGLDLPLISGIRQAAPDALLLAGGGVRSLDDIERLASAGCDGVLVATALLDGHLTQDEAARARGI